MVSQKVTKSGGHCDEHQEKDSVAYI